MTLPRQEVPCMYVSNMGKPSLVPVVYKDMKEFKLERNIMYVNSVEIFSLFILHILYMKGSTVEKNSSCEGIMGKPSLCLLPLQLHKLTLEKTLHV